LARLFLTQASGGKGAADQSFFSRTSGKGAGHILYDAHRSNPLLRFSMADKAGWGEKKAAESGLLERSLRVLA